MLRTSVLLLLCLGLLLPTSGMALKLDTTPWKAKRVVVADYTVEHWRPIVADTVEEFNAVMPPGGPTLTYEDRPSTPCIDLPPRPAKGEIWICNSESDTGATVPLRKKGFIVSAGIGFNDYYFEYAAENTVCHEMMHALTGILDNYYSLPDSSCVWGSLDDPGAWDVALLAKVYGKNKKGKHRSNSP